MLEKHVYQIVLLKKNIQPRAEEIGSVYPIPDTGQAVHCE
jgi:hypothetical protein